MNILRRGTKLFRPLGPFISFKCHRVVPKVKIASRHFCRAKQFDIWNGKQIRLQYCLSRSYCSKASGNFKLDLDRLDALNIQEIKSSECKDIILGLVTSYLYPDEQITGEEFLLVRYSLEGNHINDSTTLRQFHEQVSKSVGFQKLLETLSSHLENMGIEDLVDVFGGLVMLGVPIHNSVITELIYKFLNPELQLGFAELAKLKYAFSLSFSSKHILDHGFLVPVFKSLLMNTSSCDKKDLKFLSHLMIEDWLFTYPEIVEKYKAIISDALKNKDLHKDVVTAVQIVPGIRRCFRLEFTQKKPFSPDLVALLINLMDIVTPQIEQLTYKNISQSFRKFYKSKAHFVLAQHRPNFQTKMEEHVSKKIREMLSVNPLNFKSLNNILISDFCHFDVDEKQIVIDLMMDLIPNADEGLLYFIVGLLRFVELHQPEYKFVEYVTLAVARLLELMHARFPDTNEVENSKYEMNPYHPYDILLQLLFWACNKRDMTDLLVDFRPFLQKWLESGHACNNAVFSRLCEIGIPILGAETPENVFERIFKTISLMDDSPKIYTKHAFGILNGLWSTENMTDMYRNVESALLKMNLSAADLLGFIRNKFDRKVNSQFRINLAKKLDSLENIEECLLSDLQLNTFMTESVANRVLKYYAEHFDSLNIFFSPELVLLILKNVFEKISRPPIHMEELEVLSKRIMDTHLDKGMNVLSSYQIILFLCQLGIYFDEHIKTVFSIDYVEKLYFTIKEIKKRYVAKQACNAFVMLNRHIVILRRDLDIPWMPEERIMPLLHEHLPSFDTEIPQKMLDTQIFLSEELGGPEYYGRNVEIDYGLIVDYEYFLDSKDNLLRYDEAKKMDPTNTGIKKFAVQCDRGRPYSYYLSENRNLISIPSREKIKLLESLGYNVKFISIPDWLHRSRSQQSAHMRNLITNPHDRIRRHRVIEPWRTKHYP